MNIWTIFKTDIIDFDKINMKDQNFDHIDRQDHYLEINMKKSEENNKNENNLQDQE